MVPCTGKGFFAQLVGGSERTGAFGSTPYNREHLMGESDWTKTKWSFREYLSALMRKCREHGETRGFLTTDNINIAVADPDVH